MLRIALLFTLLAISCGPNENASLSFVSARDNGQVLSQPLIASSDMFVSLSKEGTSIFQGSRSMKFLVDSRNPKKPVVYFMNGNYSGRCRRSPECSKYHYDFARETLRISESVDEFNSVTYFGAEKRYFAGTIATYPLDGDQDPTYGIQLYPQDIASELQILELVKAVRSALKIPGAKLAFVATGNQQSTSHIQAELEQLRIRSLRLNEILGSTSFIPMNVGEAWGYVRLFPKDQDELAPTDIPVFDELPLDLSVVAATITRAFQDSNSHINLKSKERNTPNMVLRDASADHPVLGRWIDKPVHLKVTAQGWKIEASTDAEVIAKASERLRKPWIPLKWKVSRELKSFAAMCGGAPAECLKRGDTFGSKAANLGFLKDLFRNRTVPQSAPLAYDPVPVGFGVPLQFYRDFIDLPENVAIKSKVSDLIAREKPGLLSGKERAALIEDLQKAMLNGKIPPQHLVKINAMLQSIAPNIDKWKVRSSANAEDIPNFDGAGLHDSFSAKVSKSDNAENHCEVALDDDAVPGDILDKEVKPKTFACAMKAVYASLWNKRAIEERSFARIDHESVAMGLAILPSYDTESPVAANSVVVTRVINSQDILGYTLSVQKDNNTVTNPLPGTWSETSIAALGYENEVSTLTTLRFAKTTAETPMLNTTVLPRETTLFMAQLARKIETAYCRAKPSYYKSSCDEVFQDALKPKALDIEMKFLQNGEFVIKQVREFGGK